MKKILIWILALAVVLFLVFLFIPKHAAAPVSTSGYKTETVLLGSQTISVQIADTDALRELGLGNRAGLAEGNGMLFIFDEPDMYGFWMKDMNFPIDILWLNDGKIVTAAKDVSPSTYPEVFYPAASSTYVLELPAGYFDEHQLYLGDSFSVKP